MWAHSSPDWSQGGIEISHLTYLPPPWFRVTPGGSSSGCDQQQGPSSACTESKEAPPAARLQEQSLNPSPPPQGLLVVQGLQVAWLRCEPAPAARV